MKAIYLGYIINKPFKGNDGSDVNTYRLSFLNRDTLDIVTFNPTNVPDELKGVPVTPDSLPTGELSFDLRQQAGKNKIAFRSFVVDGFLKLQEA